MKFNLQEGNPQSIRFANYRTARRINGAQAVNQSPGLHGLAALSRVNSEAIGETRKR